MFLCYIILPYSLVIFEAPQPKRNANFPSQVGNSGRVYVNARFWSPTISDVRNFLNNATTAKTSVRGRVEKWKDRGRTDQVAFSAPSTSSSQLAVSRNHRLLSELVSERRSCGPHWTTLIIQCWFYLLWVFIGRKDQEMLPTFQLSRVGKLPVDLACGRPRRVGLWFGVWHETVFWFLKKLVICIQIKDHGIRYG